VGADGVKGAAGLLSRRNPVVSAIRNERVCCPSVKFSETLKRIQRLLQ
jgi:hypothetical protein